MSQTGSDDSAFGIRYQALGLSVLGALEVLLIYAVMRFAPDGAFPSPTLAATIVMILVAAATIHFGWTGRHLMRLALLAAATSLGLAMVTYGVFHQISPETDDAFVTGDQARTAYWGAMLAVFVYVIGPFIQTFQSSGRTEFPYRDLFVHSWANFHIGCVAALFLAAVYVVLALWALLFRLIGVEFFANLFRNGFFLSAVSGAAFAYGIEFARRRAELILTLRGVTLGVMKLLLPPVALIALAFVAAVPFNGLSLLWATDHASTILLFWALLMILLLNAVYQDGSEGRPFARPIIACIETAFVALPLFAGVAIYGLSLRIGQHGLSVWRTYGVVAASIVALYCVGYAAAVLHRTPNWLADMRPINRSMAWLVLVVIIALQTPWLDPYRLSADSQVRRLTDGRVSVAEFDFGYLKFQLGHVGREALEELRATAARTQRSDLTAALDDLASVDNAYVWQLSRDKTHLELKSVGPLPDGLEEALQRDEMQLQCRASSCIVFPIEAPTGLRYGVAEARTYAYVIGVFEMHADGTWYRFGAFTIDRPSSTDVSAALQARDYSLVPPELPELRIGSSRFHFQPAAAGAASN